MPPMPQHSLREGSPRPAHTYQKLKQEELREDKAHSFRLRVVAPWNVRRQSRKAQVSGILLQQHFQRLCLRQKYNTGRHGTRCAPNQADMCLHHADVCILPVLPCGGVQFEEKYLASVTERLRATMYTTWNTLLAAQQMSKDSQLGSNFAKGWMRCLTRRVWPASGNSSMDSEVRPLLLHHLSPRLAMSQHPKCGIHLQRAYTSNTLCMLQSRAVTAYAY
jgi:hypothetical protein